MLTRRHRLAGLSIVAALAGSALPAAAQIADFGKQGDPIKLTVGYQPF